MKTINKAMVAAILVAAVMLAVPLSIVIDSDAAYTEAEKGYSVKMTKPTATELTAFGETEKSVMFDGLGELNLNEIINNSVFGDMSTATVTSDTFSNDFAAGESVASGSKTTISSSVFSAKNVKYTIPVTVAGKLTKAITLETTEKEKAVIEAINAYFEENVAVGDKIVITGDIYESEAMKTVNEYAAVGDDKCTMSKGTMNTYAVSDTSITIELIKSGDESGKQIKFVADGKGSVEMTAKYEYDKDYSELTPGYSGTIKTSYSVSTSGDAYFKIDGTNYSLKEDYDPEGWEMPCLAAIVDQSSIGISAELTLTIEGLPASSDNISVEKDYADAESAFNSVKSDATGGGSNMLLIIIAIVIAVIVIGVIVFFIIKKKKA